LSAFLAFSATEWILFEKPYLWARLKNELIWSASSADKTAPYTQGIPQPGEN